MGPGRKGHLIRTPTRNSLAAMGPPQAAEGRTGTGPKSLGRPSGRGASCTLCTGGTPTDPRPPHCARLVTTAGTPTCPAPPDCRVRAPRLQKADPIGNSVRTLIANGGPPLCLGEHRTPVSQAAAPFAGMRAPSASDFILATPPVYSRASFFSLLSPFPVLPSSFLCSWRVYQRPAGLSGLLASLGCTGRRVVLATH